jgi:signal transduction histidine kinase
MLPAATPMNSPSPRLLWRVLVRLTQLANATWEYTARVRTLWIAGIGLVCALSAALSAVWVAASIPAAEPPELRAARQILSEDASATRWTLAFSCARDVQLERLVLELVAGAGEDDARDVASSLERALGGRVALYLAHGKKLSALGGATERARGLLESAREARVVEDQALPSVLDSCKREERGFTLWVARSASVPELLEKGDLRWDRLLLNEGEGAPSADGLRLVNTRGARLYLRSAVRAQGPAWLLPAALCSAGAFLLGALLALFWARRAPVEETVLATLEQAAERVAQGDLSSTIALRVHGRADQTFRSFDRMTAELRETRAKLAEAERAAAWQDMAQRVAHEIKNPLSPIKLGLETLRKAYKKDRATFAEMFEESTHAMLEEVQRIEHIVREFRDFARLPKARPGALDLGELVRELAKLYAPAEVALELNIAEGLSAHADREQISQVVGNLLANAIDAVAGARTPRIQVSAARDRGDLLVRIDDNGPGVPAGERVRIFEPYVTGKQRGTGLGLAIVRRIAQDHGGSVQVGESALGGARFELRLPAS